MRKLGLEMARSNRSTLRFEGGVQGDFRVEEFGNWTAGLGVVRRRIEGGRGGARNLGLQFEMAFGDGKTAFGLLERDGGGDVDALGGQAGSAQLPGPSHGEAAGVRGGKQFLRIRSGAVLKARRKRVLRIGKRAAGSGYGSLALFEIALPDGRCVTFHVSSWDNLMDARVPQGDTGITGLAS